MKNFRKEYLSCICGRKNLIKKENFDVGYIDCTHSGCTHRNMITKRMYYDSTIMADLKDFGKLIYLNKPGIEYKILKENNIIGRSSHCDIKIEAFRHSEKCFISNYHCTISISFDIWTGKLRYKLLDGAVDSATLKHKNSLNGTLLNGYTLRENEQIDIPHDGIVSMGGKDEFRLESYEIPAEILETYQIIAGAFNPDLTQ